MMSTLSATSRSRQQVLGYPVDIVNETVALDVVDAAWRSGKGLHIVTLNAEMVVAAQQDTELDRIIRHAHLIVPDGSGIVWALRLQGITVDRLPGIELSNAILRRAAGTSKTVALLGGRPEIMERLRQTLPEMHPGSTIVYSRDGYFSADDEESIVDEIAKAEPDLLLVALGVPKQEYFIDRWRSNLPKAVIAGVGGSFDVWSGTSKRAPLVMRKMHLEWLYRLVIEPWRWKRILSALPNFGWQVICDLLSRPSGRGTPPPES